MQTNRGEAGKSDNIGSSQDKHEVFDYVDFILNPTENLLHPISTGLIKGGIDYVNTVIHPIDNVIIPISSLLFDALVIASGQACEHLLKQNSRDEFKLLRNYVRPSEQLYATATDNMQQRINAGRTLVKGFIDAPLREKIEFMSTFASTVFISGYVVKGVQIASALNQKKLLFPSKKVNVKIDFDNPPKFKADNYDSAIRLPPINYLTINDIRKLKAETKLLYVSTGKKLYVAERNYPGVIYSEKAPRTYFYHSEIASLEEATVAGEMIVGKKGMLKEVNTETGHYMTRGDHLEHLVRKDLSNFGVTERYKFVNAGHRADRRLRASMQKDAIKKLKLTPAASGLFAGSLMGLDGSYSDIKWPSFIDEASAKSTDETIPKGAESSNEEEKTRESQYPHDNHDVNTKQKSSQETFSHNIYAAQTVFADLAGLGATLGNDEFSKAGIVGQNLAKISQSLISLNIAFPLLEKMISFAATAQPYVAAIAAAVQIGMTLFGKRKQNPTAQINIAILEGLSIIRKEMHQRHDRTDHKIAQLSTQLDQLYYSLKDVIQANHDLALANIHHVAKSLGEDIQHLEKIFSSLVKNVHLDELDKLLIDINEHKLDRAVGDQNSKLESLRKVNSKLSDIWLLKNLIGPNYNGEIYSSDSTQQDTHYVGNGILPETALGFLFQYAANHLKLSSQLADVDPRKLPLVDLWSHAIQASLTAQLLAKQQYGHELPREPELKKVADNTIRMVDTLAKHALLLFTGLSKQYQNAQNGLLSHFKSHLRNHIQINDNYYSLKHAIENKWIDLSKLSNRIDVNFQNKITAHPAAQELKLPLILLLAQKAGLTTLTTKDEPKRHPASADLGEGGCNRRRVPLIHKTLGIDYIFKITFPEGDFLFEVASSTPQHVTKTCEHRDDYSSVRASKTNDYNNLNSGTSDKTLIANSNIHSLNVNVNLRASLNNFLLDKVVDHLITMKISGEALPDDADIIYSQAISSALLDRANGNQALDMIKVNKQLMAAYSELLGLPITVTEAILSNLNSDPKKILESPTQMLVNDKHLEDIYKKIIESLPSRNSRVVQKMQAVINSIDVFYNMADFNHHYNENLDAWTADVNSLNQISQQLKYMIALRNGQLLSTCNLNTIEAVKLKIDGQMKLLGEMRQDLINQHFQLANLGYTNPTPDDLTQNPSPSDVNLSEDNIDIDAADLGYSPHKTAALIENAIDNMAIVPRMTHPGHLRFGKSGRGKSTLTNFSEFNVTYEEYTDETGATLIRPQNNAQEKVKTGSGRSITTYPGFYQRNSTIYGDFPGFFDTRGVEDDISNAFLIPSYANKFETLKTIEVIMTSADIYDNRYYQVEEILGKIAPIIARNPGVLIDNVLITISMPDKQRLATKQPSQYEQEVLAHLKKWLTYQSWFHGDSSRASTDPRYSLAILISKLSVKNIIVVDVTDARHRSRYHERLDEFVQRKTSDFDFNNFDKNVQEFKQFIEKLDNYYQQTQVKINEYIAVLGNHWKKMATNITHKSLASAWKQFDPEHQALIELAGKINQPFVNQSDLNHEITGNVSQLVRAVIGYSKELHQTKPMLDRLKSIANLLAEGSHYILPDELPSRLPTNAYLDSDLIITDEDDDTPLYKAEHSALPGDSEEPSPPCAIQDHKNDQQNIQNEMPGESELFTSFFGIPGVNAEPILHSTKLPATASRPKPWLSFITDAFDGIKARMSGFFTNTYSTLPSGNFDESSQNESNPGPKVPPTGFASPNDACSSFIQEPSLVSSFQFWHVLACKLGFYNKLPWNKLYVLSSSEKNLLQCQQEELAKLRNKFISKKLGYLFASGLAANQFKELEWIITRTEQILSQAIRYSQISSTDVSQINVNLERINKRLPELSKEFEKIAKKTIRKCMKKEYKADHPNASKRKIKQALKTALYQARFFNSGEISAPTPIPHLPMTQYQDTPQQQPLRNICY